MIGVVAQWIAHQTSDLRVVGSSPIDFGIFRLIVYVRRVVKYPIIKQLCKLIIAIMLQVLYELRLAPRQ